MSDFDLAVTSDAILPRVKVSGDLDMATAGQLLRAAQRVTQDVADLALDLSGVTFMDSTGMGVLIRIKNTVTQRGGALQLVDVSTPVQHVLALAGLTAAFSLPSSER